VRPPEQPHARSEAEPSADEAPLVYGVHPVRELLATRPGSAERLFVAHEAGGLGSVLRRAREAGIPITRLPRELLARKVGPRARHQGVALRVSPVAYADAEAVCAAAAGREDGLLVLLDGVEDPGNLGAVLRAAAAAGAHGVLLSTERSAGLSPAVAKSSAGAVERIPVARERLLARRIGALRERGFRAVALDGRAPRPWDREDLGGRLALVAGSEGRGIREAVAAACDIRVAIPLERGVESLNVAVAVGVLLFEAVRQRRPPDGSS
jgi:23S rRNA (guanosine2251-2'-O)-methyltransferase